MLARVVLRCVLSRWLRTRGFVRLVLVVIGTGSTCPPSVAVLSPSEVDSCWPPMIFVLMARLISFIAFFLVCFSNAAGFRATLPLLFCDVVAPIVSAAGSAVDKYQMMLRCRKLAFLEHKTTRCDSGPSLDHNTMH